MKQNKLKAKFVPKGTRKAKGSKKLGNLGVAKPKKYKVKVKQKYPPIKTPGSKYA